MLVVEIDSNPDFALKKGKSEIKRLNTWGKITQTQLLAVIIIFLIEKMIMPIIYSYLVVKYIIVDVFYDGFLMNKYEVIKPVNKD
jgi:hypothetical protein